MMKYRREFESSLQVMNFQNEVITTPGYVFVDNACDFRNGLKLVFCDINAIINYNIVLKIIEPGLLYFNVVSVSHYE